MLEALETTLSAFWILVNNSWMQHPVGYVVENGVYVPTDWAIIVFNSVVRVRFPHMLLATYSTTRGRRRLVPDRAGRHRGCRQLAFSDPRGDWHGSVPQPDRRENGPVIMLRSAVW